MGGAVFFGGGLTCEAILAASCSRSCCCARISRCSLLPSRFCSRAPSSLASLSRKKTKDVGGVEGGRGGVEGGQKHLFAEVGAAWGRAADEGNISLALGEENKPTKKN